MLIGGLAGIAAFEACSGVLMGAVLGLSSMDVDILFYSADSGGFFLAWFAGRPNKRFSTLMWQSVILLPLAGLLMWIPDWFGVMNVWTLLIPAAVLFGAGMLHHWLPAARWSRSLPGGHRWRAGRRSAKYWSRRWRRSCDVAANRWGSLGLRWPLMGLLIS